MGLFDRLTFEDGLDVAFPDIGADPFEITWQTKSLTRHQPMLENYKVTSAGRLLKQDTEYEHVPEEERPGYNEETDGFDTEIERAGEVCGRSTTGGRIRHITAHSNSTDLSMVTTSVSTRNSLTASSSRCHATSRPSVCHLAGEREQLRIIDPRWFTIPANEAHNNDIQHP